MRKARWRTDAYGNKELIDYSSGIEREVLKIIKTADRTFYLECPEMEFDESDECNRFMDASWLLDSLTIGEAKKEAEELYEAWLKEKIFHYQTLLSRMFGKTA